MSNRPPIPAEISRQVLIESGHRCAVCGAGCPLERAHIIPWHKSGEHKAENLICLCANCHERADKEKWGEKTLRECKRRPWVIRRPENLASRSEPMTRLTLKIEIEVGDFNRQNQEWLQSALEAFLRIPPNDVQVVSKERGSVKVTVELPTQSAERLLSAYEENNPELAEYLAPLILLDLHQEATKPEEMVRSRVVMAAQRVVEEFFSDEACFFDLISKRFFAQIERLQGQQATPRHPKPLEKAFPSRPVSAFAMALSELVPEGAAMTPRVLIAAIRMEDILLPSNSRFRIVCQPSVSPRAQKTGLRIGVWASVPQNEASGFSQNGKQR
jgi:hypothetical protein